MMIGSGAPLAEQRRGGGVEGRGGRGRGLRGGFWGRIVMGKGWFRMKMIMNSLILPAILTRNSLIKIPKMMKKRR